MVVFSDKPKENSTIYFNLLSFTTVQFLPFLCGYIESSSQGMEGVER